MTKVKMLATIILAPSTCRSRTLWQTSTREVCRILFPTNCSVGTSNAEQGGIAYDCYEADW